MLAILSVVLPAYVILAIGFLLGKKSNPDLTFISDLGVSIFIPSLMLYSIATTNISLWDLAKIVFYGFLATLAVVVLTVILSKYILRWDDKKTNSILLISCFPNTGNFGLPVALFAFGETGMGIMMIYSMAQALLCNTLGIYLASKNNYSIRDSIKNVIMMPGTAAMAIGIILKALNISLPDIILRPVSLLAQAVVPVLLICVGVQLSRIPMANIKKMFISSFTSRFIFYPLIAIPIIPLFFDLTTVAGKALLLAAFLPSAAAINTYVLKFDPENDMVPTGTLITNALCVFVIFTVLRFLM